MSISKFERGLSFWPSACLHKISKGSWVIGLTALVLICHFQHQTFMSCQNSLKCIMTAHKFHFWSFQPEEILQRHMYYKCIYHTHLDNCWVLFVLGEKSYSFWTNDHIQTISFCVQHTVQHVTFFPVSLTNCFWLYYKLMVQILTSTCQWYADNLHMQRKKAAF